MRLRSIISSLLIVLFLAAPDAGAIHKKRPAEVVQLWTSEDDLMFGTEVLLHCYKPENPNGIAMIICPGGSYCWLDEDGEGLDVAEWFDAYGITTFVLNYRTAGFGAYFWHYRYVFRGNRHPDMIMDAQRAIQWVREHAEEYGISENKVGVMGFSAGGHLAMSTACLSSTNYIRDTKSGGGREVNLRPDFVAPIYPVVTLVGQYAHARSRRGLLGEDQLRNETLKRTLSLELNIPSDCPPVFIANCVDDPVVDYHNSMLLDEALTVSGIPHKYLQYATGKHGFGVSDVYGSPECRKWKYEFLAWLEEIAPYLNSTY